MAGYQIGLDKLYVAKLLTETETGATYEAPVELAGAVSAQITPQIAETKFYASDRLAAQVKEITGAEVTISVDDLSAAALEKLLGVTKNADGVIEYKDSNIAPDVAILFRSKLHNGGYRYVSLLKGKFALNTDQFSTKGENVEMNAKEITGTFSVRKDGFWRYQVDSNDVGVSTSVIDGWFTGVYDGPTGA
jgi:phi13 family phage major tail protein